MIVLESKLIVAKPKCPSIVVRSMSHPKPERASLVTKFGRLRKEVVIWMKRGAPLVPKEIRRERLALCAACEYFNAGGNFGLGECRFPGCGCTKIKAALATSKCPMKPPKWDAWQKP
jgi:hypothetical protein